MFESKKSISLNMKNDEVKGANKQYEAIDQLRKFLNEQKQKLETFRLKESDALIPSEKNYYSLKMRELTDLITETEKSIRIMEDDILGKINLNVK
jgi:hypothetical protein